MTGNIFEDDVSEYLKAGADAVLGKPLKMSWLSLLMKYMKEKGSKSHQGMTLCVQDNQEMDWV